MKNIVAMVIGIILLASTVFATPFLITTNSYPTGSTQPDSFVISLDNGTTLLTVPAYRQADNSMILHYDLASTPKGVLQVKAAACTNNGVMCTAMSATTTVNYIIPTATPNIGISAQ